MAIKTFKHKGLKIFFDCGSKEGIQAVFAKKLELILDRLDAATEAKDMDFPGASFHLLKGSLKEFYSVHVNGNWVVIFRFEHGEANDVDLIDYQKGSVLW